MDYIFTFSQHAFWIGFAVGALYSCAYTAANFIDIRGGYFGMPRRSFGQMQATMSINGSIKAVLWVVLPPFVVGVSALISLTVFALFVGAGKWLLPAFRQCSRRFITKDLKKGIDNRLDGAIIYPSDRKVWSEPSNAMECMMSKQIKTLVTEDGKTLDANTVAAMNAAQALAQSMAPVQAEAVKVEHPEVVAQVPKAKRGRPVTRDPNAWVQTALETLVAEGVSSASELAVENGKRAVVKFEGRTVLWFTKREWADQVIAAI